MSLSANGTAHGDLASPRCHRQRQYTVDSDERQDAGDDREPHEQLRCERPRRDRVRADLIERLDILDGDRRINFTQRALNIGHDDAWVRRGADHQIL